MVMKFTPCRNFRGKLYLKKCPYLNVCLLKTNLPNSSIINLKGMIFIFQAGLQGELIIFCLL